MLNDYGKFSAKSSYYQNLQKIGAERPKIIDMLPQEEERPVDHAKDEIYFEFVVKDWVEEISMINEIDDGLSGEKEEGKDKGQVKKSSDI